MAIEVRFDVTQELLDKWRHEGRGRSWGIVTRFGPSVLTVAYVLGVPTVVLLLLDLRVALAVGWAISLLFVFSSVRGAPRSRTQCMKELLACIPQCIRLSDACLRTESEEDWTRYDWTCVDGVTRGDDSMFINLANEARIRVPNSAFRSSHEEDDIVAFLEEQVARNRRREGSVLQTEVEGETLLQLRFRVAPEKRSATLIILYAVLLAGTLYLAQGGPIREAVFGTIGFVLMIFGCVRCLRRSLSGESSRKLPLSEEMIVTLTTEGIGIFRGTQEWFSPWTSIRKAADEAGMLRLTLSSGRLFTQISRNAFRSEAQRQDFLDLIKAMTAGVAPGD